MRTEIDGIRGLALAERAAALSTAHGILVRALDDDAALDELANALERATASAADPGEAAGGTAGERLPAAPDEGTPTGTAPEDAA